jgi:RNA-binding protein
MAIVKHELIKVKVNQNHEDDRRTACDSLAHALGAEVVQFIGRTALLYRPNPDEPTIELPNS